MTAVRTCIIAGAGPAGMVAGLLLARGGVDVLVLEKHRDFLRDFRGDTIHPSTLTLLGELGLMEAFEQIGHQRVDTAQLPAADGQPVTMVDFRRLKHPYPYIAMAPQWDLLDLLTAAGERESTFELRLGVEVTGLLRRSADDDQDSARSASSPDAQVTGVIVEGEEGEERIPALLTIAADGRSSAVRRAAQLPAVSYQVPMDVWWFRLDAGGPNSGGSAVEPAAEAGEGDKVGKAVGGTIVPRVESDHPILPIPRGDYVQAAMIIPKGADATLRRRGIQALRAEVARALPELAEAAGLLSFGDVRLLDVQMDRLTRWWRPGLLCIGDAAHAMSPVGGVGVNLAVQDAVAAASLLAGPLREETISDRDVAAVQRRRSLPAALTQAGQRRIHRGLQQFFATGGPLRVPAGAARIMRRFPHLSGVPAWLIGVGVRPEHAPGWARR